MLCLDDPVETTDGISKTLRELAQAGRLKLLRMGRFRADPKVPPRPIWWVIGPDDRRYEVSGTLFRALIRLHVPEIDRKTA